MDRNERTITELFTAAGVRIGGKEPWDIQVLNRGFHGRVLAQGSLGLGESYMDGWWECGQLDQFFHRLFLSDIRRRARAHWRNIALAFISRLTNRQARPHAFDIGEAHYDAGNDLFERMLDRRMAYSCGCWKEGATLDEAQEAKLDLICRKIGLTEWHSVLDIGCGWGSFAGFAAERYGARVTGVTVSKEQADWAQRRYDGEPVEIRLEDYRDVEGQYDRVVSVGMFEHVGPKNYRAFMQVARSRLADDGLFLLHTIGSHVSVLNTDPWIERYIFPRSVLPSVAQIGNAIEGLFVIEDLHNFGADYDRTLMAWHANFERAWPELKPKYGERFGRMWRYYLLASAAMLRARQISLWQFVLSPRGIPGGYRSVR